MTLEDYFRLYLSTLVSALLLALIFYLPERLAPAEKDQPTRKRIFNLIYTPVVIAIIFLLQPLFGPLYGFASTAVNGGLLSAFIGVPKGLAGQLGFALAFAIGWDLWQYWLHRLQHTNSFLWQTHKFHHSDTALNATSQARHHALNYVLFLVSYLPVIVVFGAVQPHFLATFVMFRLWGFVNHANIRVDLGHLTPLIAGPQWHRIHHSIEAEHFNRNFATFFPFIDLVFGTYYAPKKGEYPATGLQTDRPASDFREATVAPLFEWNKMARFGLGKLRMFRRERPEL